MKDLLLSVLKNLKISISEYHILTIIYLDGNSKRVGLARYIFNYFSAACPSQVETIDKYENAIDSCLEKKLLKVITIEDCENDKIRWIQDDNHNLDEAPYFPGNIDFTKYGSNFFNDILDKLGKEKFDGYVCYKWKNSGVVSILAKYKNEILNEVEQLNSTPSHLLSDGKKLVEIGIPYSIGPWWITRFDHIDVGWRVDIKYSKELK